MPLPISQGDGMSTTTVAEVISQYLAVGIKHITPEGREERAGFANLINSTALPAQR